MGQITQVCIDYEVLASHSYDALSGHIPGWCDIEIVSSHLPIIYNLKNDEGYFGKFQLRKKPNGICEIEFLDAPFSLPIELTDAEKKEYASLPDAQKRSRLPQILNKIHAQYMAQHKEKHEHLLQVIQVYFSFLRGEGIKFASFTHSEEDKTQFITNGNVKQMREFILNVCREYDAVQDALEQATQANRQQEQPPLYGLNGQTTVDDIVRAKLLNDSGQINPELSGEAAEAARFRLARYGTTLGGGEKPTETIANQSGGDLPSYITSAEIDQLQFDVDEMKKLYRDFTAGKAIEILKAIPEAWKKYQADIYPGQWGPKRIGKEAICEAATVSNYLGVLHRKGLRTVDNIVIPHRFRVNPTK